MTKRLQLLLQVSLLLMLHGLSEGRVNKELLTFVQERIRTPNETTPSIPNECQCTCERDHGDTQIGSTLAPHNGSCGCGCGCCVRCSQFKEKINLIQKRSRPLKKVFLQSPIYQICQSLNTLYDNYQEVAARRSDLDALTTNSSGSASAVIDATRLLALALSKYKFSWIQVDLTRQLSGDSNATINANCNGNCSCNTTWERGCVSCLPKLDLTPTCVTTPTEDPQSLTTTEDQLSVTTTEDQLSVTTTEDQQSLTTTSLPLRNTPNPLNLSLCICARVLILPLETLLEALDEVDTKIRVTMTELFECRYRKDALERARELSRTLEDLIFEMSIIIAQINTFTQQRISGRLTIKRMKTVKAEVTSMNSSLVRTSSGYACTDRGQTVIEQVQALQAIIKLFLLSPTNDEIQRTLHCRAYLATTLIFKVIMGKVKLTDEEVSRMMEIFEDITSKHIAAIGDTINSLFEWNSARAATLEEVLEELRQQKETLEQNIPQNLIEGV